VANVAAVRTGEATGVKTVKVSALDVPPPGAGVITVTWSVPVLEISVAGIMAWIPVVATNVVVRGLAFHWTAEQGNRVPTVPFTVSVNAGPPTAALDGEREEMTGAGRLLVGVIIEKVAEFEVVVGLDTVTAAVPEKAMSAAVIAAVTCVEFTNVVARGDPFQFTTSPFTKPVPFTVSVKPVGAQNVVEVGEIEEMTGATIENEIALEVPPPGVGLNTLTGTDATEAISTAEIAAWSCVELT